MWGGWCKESRLHVAFNEGKDKLCAWRVKDFGTHLQRLTQYQASTHNLDNQCTRVASRRIHPMKMRTHAKPLLWLSCEALCARVCYVYVCACACTCG